MKIILNNCEKKLMYIYICFFISIFSFVTGCILIIFNNIYLRYIGSFIVIMSLMGCRISLRLTIFIPIISNPRQIDDIDMV